MLRCSVPETKGMRLTHPLCFLLDFDFLFHVYLFPLGISEFILKEGETLIGDNLDAEAVLHLPFALHGYEALVYKGGYVRVDVQGKFLYLQFVDQVVNLAFQRIRKEDGRFDGALSEAGRTGFVGSYIHGWTYALAGDLHQSEFAERQNVVLGSVFLHVLAHTFVELLPVLG